METAMVEKIKIPIFNPDGTQGQDIGTVVKVTDAKEPWTEYTLENGTKISIKLALANIAQIDGKIAPNGDPIYSVQAQQVMSITHKL